MKFKLGLLVVSRMVSASSANYNNLDYKKLNTEIAIKLRAFPENRIMVKEGRATVLNAWTSEISVRENGRTFYIESKNVPKTAYLRMKEHFKEAIRVEECKDSNDMLFEFK